MLSQVAHSGITEGATEKVTPIHRPEATVVSTDTLPVLVWCTEVLLLAVAIAPSEPQRPVQITVELAPAATPNERMYTQHSYRNGARLMLGTTV